MNKNIQKSIRLDVLGLFLAGLNNTFIALAVAVFVHGPGTTSSQPELLQRALWIAEHSVLWKTGWLYWFIPTLTFSWSYYALGRHLDGSRPWRNLAIGVALVAAAVDIVGVLVNFTVLPELAQGLIYSGTNPDLSLQTTFLAVEKLANTLTNVGGFGLYSIAGLLILPAVFSTVDFPKWLAWLGVIEWSLSIFATGLLMVNPSLAAVPLVISFLLYAPWVWGSAMWLIRRDHS